MEKMIAKKYEFKIISSAGFYYPVYRIASSDVKWEPFDKFTLKQYSLYRLALILTSESYRKKYPTILYLYEDSIGNALSFDNEFDATLFIAGAKMYMNAKIIDVPDEQEDSVDQETVEPPKNIEMPKWYKTISLLQLQLQSLQEDIPLNLVERKGDVKDLELFDLKINAMRIRLERAFQELQQFVHG